MGSERGRKPWHPDTCSPFCAILHCQARCGRLAEHGQKLCFTCQRERRPAVSS